MSKRRAEYNFPSLLLSNEMGGATLESLHLFSCAFHPTASLGCNKSLTSIYLLFVHITGEELEQFVSNCIALEQLTICFCDDIICFKVPHVLHHLNYFQVMQCKKLKVIEISAPKLSTFVYEDKPIQISLGAEVNCVHMRASKPNALCHARAEIPSFMPAVERLIVESSSEKVKTPVMSSKFLHLKYLDISLLDIQRYRQDYLCLVSFARITFVWFLSWMPLLPWRLSSCMRTAKTDKCLGMFKKELVEVQKAVEAVKRCIEGIVPSSTNFKVQVQYNLLLNC